MHTTITPQQALQRTIEHREIFFDEMLSLMRQIMAGEVSPVMSAAILTAHTGPYPRLRFLPHRGCGLRG